MKLRKIISIALLICMLFTVASCKSGKTQAKELTENFMTAFTTYDLDTISKYVEDIPDNTGTESIVDIYTSDYYRDIYAAANANVTYSIVSFNSKNVVLKYQMPNLPELYKKWVNSAISAAQNDDTVKDTIINGTTSIDPNLIVPGKMLSEIKSSGVESIEKEITLTVVKINGKYKFKNDDQLKFLMSNGLSEMITYGAQQEMTEETNNG